MVEPDEHVSIAVSDIGEGMEPQVAERAIEPFFTTKPVGKGSGLGLSMVHGFIHQSGGQLTIESARNVGTTVTIRFPCVDPQALQPPTPDADDVLGGNETILVVENNGLVLQHALRLLGSLGYQVRAAASAVEVLEQPHLLDGVDLVFADIVMPGGVDGWQLGAELRQRHPLLPIVFSSGHAYDHDEHPHLGELLTKPYRRESLGRADAAAAVEQAVANTIRMGVRTADLAPGLDATGARAAGFTLAGTREATDAIVEQLLSLK